MAIVDDLTSEDLFAQELEAKKDRICQILCCIIVALMTQQVLGAISVLLQLMLVGGLVLLKWQQIILRVGKAWPVLLFPVFALLSTLWSDDPSVSFRYGLQLVFTYLVAIAVAASITPSRLVGAIYLASLIIAILSILSGRQGNSEVGPVLVGLTGSKNQIAALAQLLLAACPLLFFDRSHSRFLRTTALVTAPAAFYLLIQAQSATGILTAIGATGLIVGLMALRVIPPTGRVAALVAVVLLAAPFVILKDLIIEQAQSVSTTVFKKDATLTGRTYLWRQADRLIEERPVVGHGYRATWLGKSATSIGLLRWADVPDPRGFNFHSTYKELRVDTGNVGAALWVIGFLFGAFVVLRYYLLTGDISCAFLLVMVATLGVKSFSELIVGPFSTMVLLPVCAAAILLTRTETDGDEAFDEQQAA